MIKKMIKKLTSLSDDQVLVYAPLLKYFILISFSLFLSVFIFQYIDKNVVQFILNEDGPSEWLGFFVLFYGALIALYFIFKKYQADKKIDLSYSVLAFLALGLMFAAMEEISYGQRIFNWSSGEFFESNNAQAETNLHNMVVKGVKLNKLIFGKILFLLMVFHNLIFPFMVRKLSWAKSLNKTFGNFAPPMPQIIILIFIAIGVEVISHGRRKEIVEVAGCLFYVLAMIAAFGYGIGMDEKIKNLKAQSTRKVLKLFCLGVPLSAFVMTLIFNT